MSEPKMTYTIISQKVGGGFNMATYDNPEQFETAYEMAFLSGILLYAFTNEGELVVNYPLPATKDKVPN